MKKWFTAVWWKANWKTGATVVGLVTIGLLFLIPALISLIPEGGGGGQEDADATQPEVTTPEATPATPTAQPVDTTSIVARKGEWDEMDRIRVPLGKRALWDRDELVGFELQTQTGAVYEFPRELAEHITIGGQLSSMKFRVMTDDEEDEVLIRIRFVDIR